MARQRKFSPGRRVESLDDLANCISLGCWFYWAGGQRPKHPSIIRSMTFSTVWSAIRNGRLRVATTNPPPSA